MLIGCPKEIKNHEYRVGLTPESVAELTARGHAVLIETGAGHGIGATDDAYRAAGADITDVETLFAKAETIVKVKEPQPAERARLREGQTLYTYLHLAPDPDQTRDLMASGATCIAYETVTDPRGGLPLLRPMSQVAGRMSIQAGAHAMEKAQGGSGVLRVVRPEGRGRVPALQARRRPGPEPGLVPSGARKEHCQLCRPVGRNYQQLASVCRAGGGRRRRWRSPS